MTTPTVIEVDCSTGISTERPMTADEIQAMNERQAANEAQRAADEAAAKRLAKPDGAMPEEQPVDTDWDK